MPNSRPCRVTFDTSGVRGVDGDAIIRPFQWKGSVKTVREFNVDAMHNELGMDAIELAGFNTDGDNDGVTIELTIGDMSAMAI